MSDKFMSFSKMKKEVIRQLRKGDPFSLDDFIYSDSQKEILVSFLEQHGTAILEWAVVCAQNIFPLAFIVDKKEILNAQKILTNEIIKAFFISQAGGEIFGNYTHLEQNLRIEKVKLLLEINNELMEKFINVNDNEPYMTKNIKADIDKAKTQIKENKKVMAL